MVNTTTLLLILVPFALLAAGIGLFLAWSTRHEFAVLEGNEEPERPPRPWWGNPLLWVGIAGGLAFLGLVVAPRLFGVAFMLLPFVWMRGLRRRPRR